MSSLSLLRTKVYIYFNICDILLLHILIHITDKKKYIKCFLIVFDITTTCDNFAGSKWKSLVIVIGNA